MPKLKKIEVKEELSFLQKLYQRALHHLRPRVNLPAGRQECWFFRFKKDLHSGRKLAEALKVDDNSIQTWKRNYAEGGLEALLSDERGGRRPFSRLTCLVLDDEARLLPIKRWKQSSLMLKRLPAPL